MERKIFYLKLKITMRNSTAAKLTKIILDTLDMWNIEKHLKAVNHPANYGGLQ